MQRKLVTLIALSVYATDSSHSEEIVKVSSLVGKLRDASKTHREHGSKLLIEQELTNESASHSSIKGDLNEVEDASDTTGVHTLDMAVKLDEIKNPSDDFKKVLNMLFKEHALSDQNKHFGDVFGTAQDIRNVAHKSDKAEISTDYIRRQNHHKLWNILRPSVDPSKDDTTLRRKTKTSPETDAINLADERAANSNEYGKFYEGDMVVETSWGRSAVLQAKLWPNRVIPFDFDNSFSHEDMKTVLRAISYLNHVTCLYFRKHWFFLDGPSYVKITNSKPGCFATVGKPSKGAGKVNLGLSCMKKEGIIMHELLHSVGLFHEHSRYDRDQHVKVNWENINPSDQHNFMMRNNFQVSRIPYDYYSIMHYSTHAYTKNGLPTLEPKKPVDVRLMGQRDFLSTWDLAKVKNLYCP